MDFIEEKTRKGIGYRDRQWHERYGYQGLDNRREPCSVDFAVVTFSLADKKIKVKYRRATTRSGYCFDCKDGGLSIGYDEIGALRTAIGLNKRWEIICYKDDVGKASEIIVAQVRAYKEQQLKFANSIVIPKAL